MNHRSPDTMLPRNEAAAALTEAGFPTSPATLATKACRGGGPPYRLYGRKPLYKLSDLLAWAEGRCSKTITSTSELEAA
jgi:alkylation response protein AidB-like acyl-CoA dehydrogenase